ncbi:hypothetical protein BD408DRAFT_409076 [Parasitella parasitica]|nr:hypothetical protein BD408DRAFT_409076 [Parasitella parasitica]
MVHADEIYNIYKKIQETFYLKVRDQKESVKLWLQELSSQKGNVTFLGTDFMAKSIIVHININLLRCNPLRYKYQPRNLV